MVSVLGLIRSRHGDGRNSARSTTACPQCHENAHFFLSSVDRNRHTSAEVFEYFQCGHCGLVFMDPIPDDLRPFYAGGYREIPSTMEQFHHIAKTEVYRLDPVLAYKTSGKLLEIGPWIGVFSYNAQQAGFDVRSIEIDQSCVDFMQQSLGISAIQSSDPAATLTEMTERFDVIALWHCLEHLQEPWRVIEAAASRLAPGGILVIAIPNIDSLEFSLLRAAWRNLDAPRHLYFFPADSLTALCRGVGLIERRRDTNDELSRAFSEETWQIVARSVLSPGRLECRLKMGLKALANRSEVRNNTGPGLTMVFGRPG